MDFLNAFVAFANFVLIPATSYGAQLALGALGVTLIYGILRFSNFATPELTMPGLPEFLIVEADGTTISSVYIVETIPREMGCHGISEVVA